MKYTFTLFLFITLGILLSHAQLPTVNPLLCTYTVGDDYSYTQNGATVTFTNTTQWTGTGYTFATAWNFGDGGTATTTTTTHTYTTPGTYSVRMVNRVNGLFPNTDYCYDTVIKQITIATYPCTVNNADYTHTENHRTATFVNTSLENSQFTYSYLWRFGDGNTSTLRSPVYTYTADGTYTVKLIQTATNTVDNNVVCVDSQSYTLTAKDWCALLNPQIQVNIQTGAHIRFMLNTASVGFTTLNATWDFGDPNTIYDTATSVYVLPFATYDYPTNGTFIPTASVTAIRTGSSACLYNLSGQVTITGYERCDSVSASYTETIDNNNVTFTNTSTQASQPPTYYWDFGDGLIGKSRDTIHTYPFLATYTVTYIISYPDYLHCADTVIRPVTISSHGYPANQNGLNTINDGYLKYDSMGAPLQQPRFPPTALPELAATYEFWYFNCEQLQQTAGIFRTNNPTPFFGVGKTYDGGSSTDLNEVTFSSDHPSAGPGGQRSLPNLHNNAWHHLAVEIFKIPNSPSCGGGTGGYGRANFYYDGVYTTTSSVNGMCADLSSMSLNIYPSMYLDEFVVTRGMKYNKTNFTPNPNNITALDTNIVALYHFNADVDSVFTDRSVFFNSANNSFDMTSTSGSVPGFTVYNAEVAKGAAKLITTAHGRFDKDSVCVGDTITFGDGYDVFLNPVQGLQQISNTKAIAITPNTTVTIGAYFVDSFTCLQLFDTLQLYIYPLPVVSAGVDTFVCFGDTVQLNATGGGTYLWNNTGLLSNATSSNPLAFPATTKNFACLITDVNGCKATDSVLVEVKALPVVLIDLQNTDTLLCNNQPALFIIDSANTGTGNLQWALPNIISSTTYTSIYQPDSSLLVVVNITDSNQCHNSDSVFVHVLISPTYVTALNDTSLCYGTPIQLLASSDAQTNLWNGLADSTVVTADTSITYALRGSNNYNFSYAPFTLSCTLTDTFALTVLSLPVIPHIADTTICSGSGISFNIPGTNTVQWNNNYANGQVIFPPADLQFTVSVTDTNTCITRDTIMLQVRTSFLDTVTSLVCSGSSYFAGGALQASSGTYYDTLATATGCDSIIVTQLTVLPLSGSNITASICAGASYSFNGQLLTAAGTYGDTLINTQGCDSLLTLTLTINPLPVLTFNLPDSICNNATAITLPGLPIGGTYTGTGISGNTFDPATATNGANYIAYSYTDSNTCSNTITDTIIVTACQDTNCHSLYTLYPDTTTPHNWFALNQATGAQPVTYLWSWGDSTSTAGATPSHTYASAGNYNVCLSIADANGCTDTYCDSSTYIYKNEAEIIQINCVMELPNGINDADYASAITIYPNPTTETLFITANGVVISEVNIYNTTGSVVLNTGVTGNSAINVSKLAPGIYIAEIKTQHAVIMKRWIKM